MFLGLLSFSAWTELTKPGSLKAFLRGTPKAPPT